MCIGFAAKHDCIVFKSDGLSGLGLLGMGGVVIASLMLTNPACKKALVSVVDEPCMWLILCHFVVL